MPVLRSTALAALVLSLLLFTLGCDPSQRILHAFPQQERLAREAVELLLAGDYKGLQADMDATLSHADLDHRLADMQVLFPEGELLSSKVVGVQSFRSNGVLDVTVILEYEFASGWALAHVTTREQAGALTITGFHVETLSDSVEHASEFTLTHRSLGQYAFLLAAVLDLAFIGYVFVRCARSPVRKKWLWLLACVVGVVPFTMNWATGHVAYRIFFVQVPPATAGHSLYSPWLFIVSVPLGALLCLVHLRNLRLSNLTAE